MQWISKPPVPYSRIAAGAFVGLVVIFESFARPHHLTWDIWLSPILGAIGILYVLLQLWTLVRTVQFHRAAAARSQEEQKEQVG